MADAWIVTGHSGDEVEVVAASAHVVDGHLLFGQYGGAWNDAPNGLSRGFAPGTWASFQPKPRPPSCETCHGSGRIWLKEYSGQQPCPACAPPTGGPA